MKKSSGSLKKRLFIFSGILLTAVIIILVLFITPSGNKTPVEETSVSDSEGTPVYNVETVPHFTTIEVTNHIKPVRVEELGFNSAGQLILLNVQQGSQVKKNDLLAQLDDKEEQFELATMDLQIEEEKFKGSKRKIDILNFQRELKIAALDNKKIYSPIDGLVTKVEADLDDYIAADKSIIRIIDKKSMVALVEVDELDIPSVKIGQKVLFSFEAILNQEFIGSVSKLPLEGRVNAQGITVFDVEIKMDNPPEEIMPNYSFTANIITNQEELLVVDVRGIMEDNGTYVAYKYEGENQDPKRVQLVVEGYRQGIVRIITGLEKGDQIYDVTAGIENLATGKNRGSLNVQVPGIGGL